MNTEQRQNIINLPLPQRVVAVALKHIFDQIRQIQEQQNKEIQKTHHSFVGKFKDVEEKANAIIQGQPIDSKLIQKANQYIDGDQLKSVANLAANNKGISAYWLTALLNFYGQDLSAVDKEIAAAIINISTNVFEDRLQLIFQLGKNDYLSSGTFTRKFHLEDGRFNKIDGNIPTWLKQKQEGIIGFLLSDIPVQELTEAANIAGEFINEIVPYSLQYFLGAVEQIQLGQDYQGDQDGQDYQDVDEDEDEGPAKKVKQ